MCIVIDTNAFHSVFKSNTADHASFEPVLKWIKDGKGKIVYGGTKYLEEIPVSYLAVFKQLKDAGLAVHIKDKDVDAYQVVLESKNLQNFNDHHLIAIISISGCRLLCTKNISKQAGDIQHIKDKSLYNKGVLPPKIYSNIKNESLLSDRNIADCCKPCLKTTNAQRDCLKSII